jgi:ATP-dependent Zn protease
MGVRFYLCRVLNQDNSGGIQKMIWLWIKKNWYKLLFIIVGGWFFFKMKRENTTGKELMRLNGKSAKLLAKKEACDKELKKIKEKKEKARDSVKKRSIKSVFNSLRRHSNKPD